MVEIDSYDWVIYITTFLLTFSIFFIFVLIVIKCVQTCIQTRLFCFRKRSRTSQQQSDQSMPSAEDRCLLGLQKCCISCLGSGSSDSESDSNESEDDSDSDSDEDSARVIHSMDHSSVFVRGFDNRGFDPELDMSKANRSQSNLINRKYDDHNRYGNGQRAVIVTKKPESQHPLRPPSYQISSISNHVKYPVLPQHPNDCKIMEENQPSTVLWINEANFSGVNLISALKGNHSESDPDLAPDDEIPPSYDQVVNESAF